MQFFLKIKSKKASFLPRLGLSGNPCPFSLTLKSKKASLLYFCGLGGGGAGGMGALSPQNLIKESKCPSLVGFAVPFSPNTEVKESKFALILSEYETYLTQVCFYSTVCRGECHSS